MSFRTILLYPFKANSRFDVDYYINTHLPLVEKLFGPYGMTAWEVTKFSTTDDQQFSYQVILKWETAKGAATASASPGAKQLRDDIANFSDDLPIALTGALVKTSS